MGKTIHTESGVNKKYFTLTLSGILLLSVAAFVFISVPNEGVPRAFRYALITAFAGFALAIGLYHLFLYLFAARERYFLLYAVFCLPVIARFAAMEGGIADLIAPVSVLPALHYVAEVSLLLVNAIGVWFTHELLKIQLGGWLTRAAYIMTIGLPLTMTAVTGQTVGTWWFPLCGVPYIFITVKAFADKRCRANPYVIAYICVMIYNLLLPLLLMLPPLQSLFAPLVPSMLMQMLVQSALISHSYGESKRREQRLAAEKERISAELNVATQIQESMLPSIYPAFPEHTEFDLYASMQPAKEVGGDFYDFFLVDKNTLAVVVADVSDKGVHSALFMVIAKTLIKNNAQNGMTPKGVFETVNNLLCDGNKARMFVTAFLGYLHIPSGRFTYVNAGHNPPFAKLGADTGKMKSKNGFVLALMKDMKYTEGELTLQVGDELFLYTDGATDAENNEGKQFGESRLLEIVERCAGLPPSEQLQLVKREIDSFAEGAAQADDITMLALRYKGALDEGGSRG